MTEIFLGIVVALSILMWPRVVDAWESPEEDKMLVAVFGGLFVISVWTVATFFVFGKIVTHCVA